MREPQGNAGRISSLKSYRQTRREHNAENWNLFLIYTVFNAVVSGAFGERIATALCGGISAPLTHAWVGVERHGVPANAAASKSSPETRAAIQAADAQEQPQEVYVTTDACGLSQ